MLSKRTASDGQHGFYASASGTPLRLFEPPFVGRIVCSSNRKPIVGRCRENLRLVDIDHLLDRIYKTETIELLKSVSSGFVHLIGQPNGTVKSIPLTETRPLSTAQLELFRGLLLDYDSYCFAKKRCIPRPTASFRLVGDDESLTVTVGFACSGWIVQTPRDRRGSFFDPVGTTVLSLVKELFPEYASPNPRNVWRAGVIKSLLDAATEKSA